MGIKINVIFLLADASECTECPGIWMATFKWLNNFISVKQVDYCTQVFISVKQVWLLHDSFSLP